MSDLVDEALRLLAKTEGEYVQERELLLRRLTKQELADWTVAYQHVPGIHAERIRRLLSFVCDLEATKEEERNATLAALAALNTFWARCVTAAHEADTVR